MATKCTFEKVIWIRRSHKEIDWAIEPGILKVGLAENLRAINEVIKPHKSVVLGPISTSPIYQIQSFML